jgi:hypothetical protein
VSPWEQVVAEMLAPLRREHLVVDEDNWYSCPMSEECNRDSYTGEPRCNCGADAHNARVDETAARIARGVEAAVDSRPDLYLDRQAAALRAFKAAP